MNNEIIPAVKLNHSFAYLGKEFCYNMSCENVKCDLVKRLSDYLKKIHIFFLHPKHKINILKKFVYSKLRWALTIYNLPETWIVQNLDHKANRFIRKWLSIPISESVNHLLIKPNNLILVYNFPVLPTD